MVRKWLQHKVGYLDFILWEKGCLSTFCCDKWERSAMWQFLYDRALHIEAIWIYTNCTGLYNSLLWPFIDLFKCSFTLEYCKPFMFNLKAQTYTVRCECTNYSCNHWLIICTLDIIYRFGWATITEAMHYISVHLLIYTLLSTSHAYCSLFVNKGPLGKHNWGGSF